MGRLSSLFDTKRNEENRRILEERMNQCRKEMLRYGVILQKNL